MYTAFHTAALIFLLPQAIAFMPAICWQEHKQEISYYLLHRNIEISVSHLQMKLYNVDLSVLESCSALYFMTPPS